ncbi:MAG: M23 family metallopeptidase [Spirochaetes bacterium]|nr:M23 family metallopeptidase [Spirochaetota bacterium]
MAFATETVFVDNSDVQQYRGELGKWMSLKSMAELNVLMSKYDTNISKVREINGASFSIRDYIFVPYSEKYVKELESQGVTRKSVEANENDFLWPLNCVDTISSPFGMRGRQMHTGTDMPSPRGTLILAAMDGRAVFTGYTGGHGRTIYLEHRNDFFTRYSHCSVILVKNGDYVKRGQVIGLVGSSGRSTGNHLHFEIRYKDVPLNPLDFLPINDHLKEAHQLRNWR